jgi:hypothetical protein
MGWASLVASTRQTAHRILGGVSVTAGAVSGFGILNHLPAYVGEDESRSVTEYELTHLQRALFGGLLYDDYITVAGESYKVRQEARPYGDGSDCFVLLTKLDVVTGFGRIMLEGGGFLLLEDGGYFLLEA